jgi:hypothetical protein
MHASATMHMSYIRGTIDTGRTKGRTVLLPHRCKFSTSHTHRTLQMRLTCDNCKLGSALCQ